MIRRILLLVLVVALGAGCGGPKRLPPLSSSIPYAGPTSTARAYPIFLTVGLAENVATLELNSNGKCLVLDGSTGRHMGFLTGGVTSFVCQPENGSIGLQWEQMKGQAQTVRLQPVDPDTHVQYDGREYKGEFLVIASPDGGGLTLINNIELETYLRGVLPWEIGRPGPDAQAALEAQAVAARTYTVSKLGSRQARGFDVVATVMDQVYRGCKDEAVQCNQAIEATAGIVLQFAGKEINAYYSSCCGGVGSQIEEVWPRDSVPYLRSHLDAAAGASPAFCSSSRHFNWQENWDVRELEITLEKTLPQYMEHMSVPMRSAWAGTVFTPGNSNSSASMPGKLLDLDIQKRTSSGRVALLSIVTTAGSYNVRGDRIRWVFPPADGKYSILRSALFDIKLNRQGNSLVSITINGHGNGHGLGMCQTGALEMARQGYTYRKILEHYYEGAVLTNLRPAGSTNGR